MSTDRAFLAIDLIQRTEQAVDSVVRIMEDTGVTFTIGDIVQKIERELPDGYAASVVDAVTLRELITDMVDSMVSGEAYDKN
ncbi:hypothetical protein [Streptomyces sp. CA2R106]|uniref:hypothetical protein n=1 Tax=Streptomyces sp. CA2R106 TaxID=3120153 RepID=UPI00300B80D9